MFQAPATRALVHAALEKLAVAATRGFATSSNATAEFLAPMRPLLADIPTVESVVAVRGTAASEDWALALRLGPARLAAWTNQLQTAVKKLPSPSWNLGLVRGVVHGDFGGADPKVRVKFQQVGDWLLFGGGPGKRALLEAWLADAKSSGTPRPPLGADWLRVEAGPQLARLLDWPDLADWPHLTAGFSSRSDIVRTEARLSWREPMVSSLQPWQVPTNTIRDPLVSFTAARGVAPWLGRNAALRTSAAGPVPDQWFSWSRSDIPFQTLFALPAKDAAARVPALLQPLESAARAALGTNFTGRIHHVTDRNEVVWSGLPILVPFVGVAPEPSGSFILGGLMSGIVPQGVNTNPAPAELLAQLGRTNLVYYDWEVTQFRLQQVRQTRQLLQLLGGPGAGLMGRTPGQAWLDAIAPQLGNTITEATIDGPKELRVIRNSHAGLTGFELLMLARWLDNPDFPAWREPAAAFPGLPPVPSLPPGK
ncbi:MAG: hypothetical protein FJ386_04805 [Verrucomicrobia bacterium]|nr:hypothetical protein [Verrucomicrobiota bacterium]